MNNPGWKNFFAAGLKMEAAREAKDAAKDALLEAAKKQLPEEHAAFAEASDAVSSAEKGFSDACRGVAQAQYDTAHEMLHQHGVDCGDPKCRIGRPISTGANSDKN